MTRLAKKLLKDWSGNLSSLVDSAAGDVTDGVVAATEVSLRLGVRFASRSCVKDGD